MEVKNSEIKKNGKKTLLAGKVDEVISLNRLDLNNAISFIGNDERNTYDLLDKIKVSLNLLFNDQTFMELIKHSIVNNKIGKKFILGNSSLHNFIVTSVISNCEEEESYVIVLKYIQKINELQKEPGTINCIILKRYKINELNWENKAEISFMNMNGHEYIMKISFFNHN